MRCLALIALLLGTAGADEPLAADVTIYRDEYGVPHVFGKTDAATLFGLGYAEAEDYLSRVEESYLLALGRSAELHGAASVGEDWLTRALGIPTLAQAEYARLSPEMKALCDAFAAGLNFYVARHPGKRLAILTRFEPWHPLAFIRWNYYQAGFAREPKLGVPFPVGADYTEHLTPAHNGSNGWAIGKARSASGHPLLLINPHLGFFGPGQVFEAHIHSDSGWAFSGYARYGFPMPYIGHNDVLGWMSTDNLANLADAYAETFVDDTHYRYGKETRAATVSPIVVLEKTPAGLVPHHLTVVRTHHGPILARKDGKPLAARLAKLDADGWLAEWYGMTRAQNLAEFKRAVAPLDMSFGNIMYADRAGNLFYLYNGAVPRRDPRFDWNQPVDGSDPATEWQGWLDMKELPSLENPASGWMQNCNDSPAFLTTSRNPDLTKIAPYVVREGRVDGWAAENQRGRASRRILSRPGKIDFDTLTRLAFDSHVETAESELPAMLKAVAPSRPDTREAVALLSAWDRRATSDSVAMSVFSAWHRSLLEPKDDAVAHPIDGAKALATLESALEALAAGSAEKTWRVPWGDLNRLQRPDERGLAAFERPPFDDARPSIPVRGVPGRDGAVFTFDTRAPTGKRGYGTHGATYVSVVEFAPKLHARSIVVFGTSGDPASPHYQDQAPLYAEGHMKEAWWTREDVVTHARASYHPGEE